MQAKNPYERKRQFPRREYCVPVEAVVDEWGEPVEFDSLNVSEGGMFLRSQYLLDPEEQLWVRFSLDDSSPKVRAYAHVVWVTKGTNVGDEFASGMGVEFMVLRPKDRRNLARFCDVDAPHAAN
jgi:c-di-GMP-binding flagellar brake protein YcgR